jgi:hypothetical protein
LPIPSVVSKLPAVRLAYDRQLPLERLPLHPPCPQPAHKSPRNFGTAKVLKQTPLYAVFNCSPLKHSHLSTDSVAVPLSFASSTTNAELSDRRKTNIIVVVFLAGDNVLRSPTHRATALKLAIPDF